MTVGAIRILQVGIATTVQDHGRHGLGHLGVPLAGAVDRAAHDRVNRLVGNPEDAATIETLGGLVIEARSPLVVARSSDASRHTLVPGDRLRVDPPDGGVWGYLAVRGGLDVPPVLGSRSHDTLSGLGPPALSTGDEIGSGPDPATELVVDHAPSGPASIPLRLWRGPQHDWFVGGRDQLVRRTWVVSPESSRVGVRLQAAAFERSNRSGATMESIGLVEGAIQITPAGEPIVMLANHPTTGGYPVIAVVDPDDLGTLVQTPPGGTVTFRRAADDRAR